MSIKTRLSNVFLFGMLSLLVSCGGGSSGSGNKIGDLTGPTAKAITSFSFSLQGETSNIVEADKSIAITVPYGTEVNALTATFTVPAGAGVSIMVGTTPIQQKSGETQNNFTSPVSYTVTAQDGSKVDYTVKVTVAANTAKKISKFVLAGKEGDIDEIATDKTISFVFQYGTVVSGLKATFQAPGASSVMVGDTPQFSSETPNDFSKPVKYTVTAADGTKASYTVMVSVSLNTDKSITVFKILGETGSIDQAPATNKPIAVTVPYGSDITKLTPTFSFRGLKIEVAGTPQVSGVTEHSFLYPVTYTVTADDGGSVSYVVTVKVGPNTAKLITGFSIAAKMGSVTGKIDESQAIKTISIKLQPGSLIASYYTTTALIASFTASPGATVTVGGMQQLSGTTSNLFNTPLDYIVTAENGTTAIYRVTVSIASSAKAITAFSISGVTGSINETNKTIALTMPPGDYRGGEAATFLSTGDSVTVGGTPQTSGVTSNNFVNTPVSYVVTAEDGTTATYIVTMTVTDGHYPNGFGGCGCIENGTNIVCLR